MIPLERVILALNSKEEVDRFFDLIFSTREREWMARRWYAVQVSLSTLSQRSMAEAAKVSLATANRGARSARKHRFFLQALLTRIEHNKYGTETQTKDPKSTE